MREGRQVRLVGCRDLCVRYLVVRCGWKLCVVVSDVLYLFSTSRFTERSVGEMWRSIMFLRDWREWCLQIWIGFGWLFVSSSTQRHRKGILEFMKSWTYYLIKFTRYKLFVIWVFFINQNATYVNVRGPILIYFIPSPKESSFFIGTETANSIFNKDNL